MCVEVVVPEDEWWPTSDCRRRGVCGVQLSWSTGTARTLGNDNGMRRIPRIHSVPCSVLS